jgi:hypothetical protein
MSVITAVSTIVGLDVALLGMLAYVLRAPFRLAPSPTVALASAQPEPSPAVAHAASRSRSPHGPAVARTTPVGVATGD